MSMLKTQIAGATMSGPDRGPEWDARQKAIAYADRLMMMAADEAPTPWVEKKTYDLANEIRRQFTYSPDLRKKEILAHLKRTPVGGLSIADLVTATGYHKNQIYELTGELETEGRVEFRRLPPAGGGPGRPAVRIFARTGNFSASKQ